MKLLAISSFSLLTAFWGTCSGAEVQCTRETANVRKEWAALTPTERIDYIDALHCLAEKPPVYDTQTYPGVRTRWDDFVATHINYTLYIHFNGLLLPWHRNFIHLWETALREECGYKGYQPYWDWPSNSHDLANSPHFDGSPTSLSGDGEYDEHAERDPTLPKGTGGGCVLSGPFKNHTVNMGPFYDVPSGVFPPNAFAYNPHCLRRDLNTRVSAYCNSPDVTAALLAAPNITEFQTIVDKGLMGVHLNGPHGCAHASVGSVMGDLWAAVADPSFFLHHANLDRMWALWQEKDEATRRVALNGTSSIYNSPETPDVTLDSILLYGKLDQTRQIREMMDPMGGRLCYRYE
ncbi:tyrosinase family protein [Aspergillus fischeri NRRL 181]|uniref:Tyrosinase central domain protein n=1 Tax=Neosartorya fischeri (strain ATCC 1020 / DSM 3700 / CBS 544.65 / FGSC A1164 / JCM 1740 / NRRL 181 / WB 181) TaxID=331117 RepID=A1CVG0_NEOFI|nr:tyrosinase central domain protein [Aspergillus fischeri NRRL 181]EAW25737.1 tyrosinase central domain protein [Aspergillus fischeri NRRL 181]